MQPTVLIDNNILIHINTVSSFSGHNEIEDRPIQRKSIRAKPYRSHEQTVAAMVINHNLIDSDDLLPITPIKESRQRLKLLMICLVVVTFRTHQDLGIRINL